MFGATPTIKGDFFKTKVIPSLDSTSTGKIKDFVKHREKDRRLSKSKIWIAMEITMNEENLNGEKEVSFLLKSLKT